MTAKGLTGRALGEAVLEHVLTHPEKHDQQLIMDGGPTCGTSGCIAGWAIALHHGLMEHDPVAWADAIAPYVDEDNDESEEDAYAATLLGVDRAEFARAVFLKFDRDDAISNFKHLLDETYSERIA